MTCSAIEDAIFLAERLAGLDLQYRRDLSPEWPQHWRARLITNKNERAAFRVTGFGDTMEAACTALVTLVDGAAEHAP